MSQEKEKNQYLLEVIGELEAKAAKTTTARLLCARNTRPTVTENAFLTVISFYRFIQQGLSSHLSIPMNFSWQALVAFCEPSQAKVKTLERLVQRARQPTTGCENQDKSLTKSATSQGRLKELERPVFKRRQGSSSARAVCTEFEAHCTRKGCAGSPS